MRPVSRADLHVHSRYSNKPSIWAMRKINCPESYTQPEHIYRTARAKGMDFVTITDHNAIHGALEIAHLPGAFISVELTSYFPENGGKVHVVALDITETVYRDLMELRKNIYELVVYLRSRGIVHYLAHPLYDMDDRLTADTVELLLLLFDVIEVRNGSRAYRFNGLMQNIVRSLDPERYERLRHAHGERPEWSPRWQKSMVGGSDDHSGFFIARSHTITPAAASPREFLARVMRGDSQAAGEDGDALTLAHTIYGIAYRFYQETVKNGSGRSMFFLNLLADRCFHGREKLTPLQKIEFFVRKNLPDVSVDMDTFERVLDQEARRLITDRAALAAMNAEDRNRMIFSVASRLANRMLYRYTSKLLQTSLSAGVVPFLQSLGTLGALHALASPYYVAFYHQHRSKPLLRQLESSFGLATGPSQERTALFTDTLHEINGVAMTIKRLVRTAAARGVSLTVFTTGTEASPAADGIMTFPAVGDFSLPEYPELKLRFPPSLDILDAFERGGFSKVHISTPGTMGLLGLAVAKLLNVPVAGTYHTDIPQYVRDLTNDVFLENTAWSYIIWFYNQMDEVLVTSQSTRAQLVERGLVPDKVRPLPRWVDSDAFSPEKRDWQFWRSSGLDADVTFLYAGRVSKEKNLALLADAFRDVVQAGMRAGLVIVGDGPFRQEMEESLRGLPVLFTGFLHGEDLAKAYASSDIFVFPSATDTFGNVVLEAQASGLPVIVSDKGGPQELMEPDETGLVIRANDRSGLKNAMMTFVHDRRLGWAMGEQARRFIETRAPQPEEVYSTILQV